MKDLAIGLIILALTAVAGCNQNPTGAPAAPNLKTTSEAVSTTSATSTTVNRPVYDAAEGKFELSAAMDTLRVKQGESRSTTINLSGGQNFKEDVTLEFSDVPRGITVTPTVPMIRHGEGEASLSFSAADDSAVGEHTIKVLGIPANGEPSSCDFKLIVSEK